MNTATVHPGRAVYSTLRYWRSMGLQHLELPEVEEVEEPGVQLEQRLAQLTALENTCSTCRDCACHEGRSNSIVGQGPLSPNIMFIGSTPGASEEAGSSPLQGDEGQLLDRMFSKMGIQRSDVYLCHALPCRPAQDRTPTWDELNACRPKLLQRVEQVQPKIIVTLGTVATQALLSRQVPITKVRGQWQDHVGTPVMPTYHPAYLLKKTSARKDVWSDMLAVLKALNPKG